ncbi:uncharacterized protein LOC131952839 isoform X2 [Physella acuta]|nr:uncharacterized protein LOC131952839 isoform X2 [Physella acuta]
MSLSLIVQCLVIYFSALGTYVHQLSDSATDCGMRHFLPITMDQVFMGCYLVLLLERISAVHFQAFHSLIPRIDTLMVLYGWSYGFYFLFLNYFEVLSYKSPFKCVTPFLDQLPQEPISFFIYVSLVFATALSIISEVLRVPQGMSKVEKMRQEIETRGTSVVLAVGVAFIVLATPRQSLAMVFWSNAIDVLSYQVYSKITSMIARLYVLVPFFSLLVRPEFRSAIKAFLTCSSLEPLKRKIRGQENYIMTVQKMVDVERKLIVDKIRSRIASTKPSTTALRDRTSAMHMEPRAREDFSYLHEDSRSIKSTYI